MCAAMSEPRRHGSRDTVAHFGQKESEGSTFSSTVFFLNWDMYLAQCMEKILNNMNNMDQQMTTNIIKAFKR